jgi:hypothetical protein
MNTAILLRLFKVIFGDFVRDFLFKTVLGMAQDSFLATTRKIQWRVVIERFLTRIIVLTLRWVKGLGSNTLVDNTVDDILGQLRENGLAQANDTLSSKPDKTRQG